ncbi:MAG: hypothetical protein U9N59_05065 [Campylobacterota bacterium]|nr:hypothetical protein [Campylobacterota bacterium]
MLIFSKKYIKRKQNERFKKIQGLKVEVERTITDMKLDLKIDDRNVDIEEIIKTILKRIL